MKRLLYILTVLIFFGCNSGFESDRLKDTEALELEETSMAADETVLSAIDFNEIALQKLRDYTDLLILEAKHPDFAGEVSAGLKALSEERLIDFDLKDSVRIENLVPIGPVEIVSDSIQKIPYSFTIVSGNSKITDTLRAVILKRKVQFEYEEVVSYKLTFERNE